MKVHRTRVTIRTNSLSSCYDCGDNESYRKRADTIIIDEWNLIAELKEQEDEATKINIRVRGSDGQIELLMKHDPNKAGCIDEVIQDMTRITEGLKVYKKSIDEKKR